MQTLLPEDGAGRENSGRQKSKLVEDRSFREGNCMSMTDPIADYLTRVRNALQAHHKKVDIPASRLKRELTKILLQQKFIASYAEISDGKQGILRIYFKYHEGKGVINGLERISTPGRRVYADSENLPRVLNGLGMAIISTSRGVMTNKEARRQHVGGEVVCRIW